MEPIWRGIPVPREVFDPSFNFHPDMTDDLIAKFLETLKPDENPFLVKKEDLIANGFEGTPYKWTGR